MNKKLGFFSILGIMALLAILYSSCVKDKGKLPSPVNLNLCDSLNVKYAVDIKPIIQTQCVNPGCHDPGSGSYSGYDITTYQTLKTFADQGRIHARVLEGNINGWMPTTGPLSVLDRQKIECWLNAGAPNN